MNTFLRLLRKFVVYAVLVIISCSVLVFVITSFVTTPSNDRNWNEDQKILPSAEVQGDKVMIRNIRNFSYASTTSYTAHYYDKTFDLNEMKKVWYVVEPFSGIPGSAHTFLSFEFERNQFVSISVEIRKEKGEAYHPFKGLFNNYELMYVIADESDVIKLRSNYRKDLVYVYPIKTTSEKARALFLDMVSRANTLKDHPEFYNTVTNTCTTNIVHHVNTITPHKVPFFNLRILLPANSDKLAYGLGLIDTDLSFEKARERFLINDRAMKYANDPDFSVKIRGEE
ncbi:MAG: DUF4105 domain-containing protein [Candidatus Taylorbacteria bacterium]|nr:DUF4105 domain-containing protein [Candidatus Taylorbacteria bacterium]